MPVTELKGYLQEHWPRIKEVLLAGKDVAQPVLKVEIPYHCGGVMSNIGCLLMLIAFGGAVAMAIGGNWLAGVLPMAGAFVLGITLLCIGVNQKSKRDRENTWREYQVEKERNRLAKRKARQAMLDEAVSRGDPDLVYRAFIFDMRVREKEGSRLQITNCDL
jgi:hypothetical protein